MRGGYRETVHVGGGDRARGDELSSGALPVSQMALADFFTDRNDDALPPDHGSETKRDRDPDLDPSRDELCRSVERLLVGVQRRDVLLRQFAVLILHHVA